MLVTTDFSIFGTIQREEAAELILASAKQGFPENFDLDGVTISFNTRSGFVFFTNSNYQVCMLNGSELEQWYSTPYDGQEGFANDLKEDLELYPDDWHLSDIEYLLNEGIITTDEYNKFVNIKDEEDATTYVNQNGVTFIQKPDYISIFNNEKMAHVYISLTKLKGNAQPYFSITADVFYKDGSIWRDGGCGCQHDFIQSITDYFDDIIGLHLCVPDGVPHIENALYFMGFSKNAPEKSNMISAMKILRLSESKLNELKTFLTNYIAYYSPCETDNPSSWEQIVSAAKNWFVAENIYYKWAQDAKNVIGKYNLNVIND